MRAPWRALQQDEGKRVSLELASNLLALCRRHHRLKTHNNWTLDVRKPTDAQRDNPRQVQPADTIIEWRSPRGAVHRRTRPMALEDSGPLESADAGIRDGTGAGAGEISLGNTDLENALKLILSA